MINEDLTSRFSKDHGTFACSAPSPGLPAGKVRSDRKKAFPLEVP